MAQAYTQIDDRGEDVIIRVFASNGKSLRLVNESRHGKTHPEPMQERIQAQIDAARKKVRASQEYTDV